MGRTVIRHEDHPLQIERLQGIAGQDEMPGVDGIERAAEDADPHGAESRWERRLKDRCLPSITGKPDAGARPRGDTYRCRERSRLMTMASQAQ